MHLKKSDAQYEETDQLIDLDVKKSKLVFGSSNVLNWKFISLQTRLKSDETKN